jgi:transposase-like protein
MAFAKEVLDEILKNYHSPDDFYGPEGIMKQLTKALVERTMEAELTDPLGYEKHDQGEKNRKPPERKNQQRPENGRGADEHRGPPWPGRKL